MKNNSITRITAVLLTILLTVSLMPLSIGAESLRIGISEVSITDLDQPLGYSNPDFDVSVPDGSPYTVFDVMWKDLGTGEYMTSADEFIFDHEYEVEIVLQANTYYYFFTDAYGYPTVSGSLNGDEAEVGCAPSDVINDSNYESTNVAIQKFVSVQAVFTAWEYPYLIEEINFSVARPMPEETVTHRCSITGGTPSWVNSACVSIDSFVWTETESGRVLEDGETFKYGTLYTATISLSPLGNYLFADDPNHGLATSDKPFTAVSARINGEVALVQPDFDKGPARKHIVISRMFECNAVTTVTEVNVELSAPKTGGFPSYVTVLPYKGLELAAEDTAYQKNGISWTVTGGEGIPVQGGFTFEPNSSYSVAIRINALPGFEFNNPTVTVNGKPAQLIPGKDSIVISYNFPATGNRIISSVSVVNLNAPRAGESPDYTADIVTSGCQLAPVQDTYSKNGVYWFNETTKSAMKVGIDKFKEGCVYSVTVSLTANIEYEFAFKDGVSKVSGYVNGANAAEVYARSESEVFITYTFPAVGSVKTGDINKDGIVNIEDVIALFRHNMMPTIYPINYTGSLDFNKDGIVDIGDCITLFRHSMMPDLYPLD